MVDSTFHSNNWLVMIYKQTLKSEKLQLRIYELRHFLMAIAGRFQIDEKSNPPNTLATGNKSYLFTGLLFSHPILIVAQAVTVIKL